MPYFITDKSADCSCWATVKADGEVLGCHETKQEAIDQMVALSVAEGMEPGGELRDVFQGAYIITDIDGTLTTTGDTPRQPLIDWLKTQVQDYAANIIVVSARNIDRLGETKEWLDANGVPYSQIYLQDFGESNPAVNEAYKAYRYSKLQEEYGDALAMVIDNDPEARDAAEGMGIDAYTPEQILSGEADGDQAESDEARVVIDVPEFIRDAAAKGLTYYENGYAGDGLQEQTVEEARQLRAGQVEDDKVTRMRAWILRHRGDWEGVPRNSDAANDEFPGPGAVAGYLWGVEVTQADGTDRVLQWADRVLNTLANNERFDVKEFERRALPMGEFTVSDTEDGQKTFSGYAALFDTPSAGLPFTEVIAPGAFKRTLSRAAAGSKVIAFLFGHDESRALATTASGRLSLQEDERGLRVEAKLDPADPDAAGVISKLTHEAAAMGMSFGFSTPKGGDEWQGDKRTIREVNLFEVSVLSAGQTPAYPATLGLTAVRKLSADKIGVEAERLMTTLEAIKAAQTLSDDDLEVIDQVRSKLSPRKGIDPSVAAAKLLLERLANDTL
jgi:HK97 family phage prohead protease